MTPLESKIHKYFGKHSEAGIYYTSGSFDMGLYNPF